MTSTSRPAFFSRRSTTATLGCRRTTATIGGGVGHELTHGFDDEGRQFDANGNLRDWWTAEDGKHFEEKADCEVKEYSNFVAVDDVKVNGKLTLGENTADNGGLRLATSRSWRIAKQKKHRPGKKAGRLHADPAILPGPRTELVRRHAPEQLACRCRPIRIRRGNSGPTAW